MSVTYTIEVPANPENTTYNTSTLSYVLKSRDQSEEFQSTIPGMIVLAAIRSNGPAIETMGPARIIVQQVIH